MSTRVLVVDDEMDTLSLLRTILQISGFEPVTTLNSVDAISLAETEKPDVVLLDIMMPRLDGFTLCKMMRQNLATSSLPIRATAQLDQNDRAASKGAASPDDGSGTAGAEQSDRVERIPGPTDDRQ
jgi:DNA-binding response OmpR family regulator